MQSKRTLCLIFAITLGGCAATVPMQGQSETVTAKQFESSENLTTVYIYRRDGILLREFSSPVFFNGATVCWLPVNTFCKLTFDKESVEVGTLQLSAFPTLVAGEAHKMTLKSKPSGIYFIQLSYDSFPPITHPPRLEIMDSNPARHHIGGLGLTKYDLRGIDYRVFVGKKPIPPEGSVSGDQKLVEGVSASLAIAVLISTAAYAGYMDGLSSNSTNVLLTDFGKRKNLDVSSNMAQGDQLSSNTFTVNGTQTYMVNGNLIHGPDGRTYQRNGNVIFGGDGSTYIVHGNTIYGGDGTTYQMVGNTLFGSNGVQCTSIGSAVSCAH